jgi:hypothetical protein
MVLRRSWGVSLLQRDARAGDSGAPGGAGAASRALPAVDAVLSSSGAVGANEVSPPPAARTPAARPEGTHRGEPLSAFMLDPRT